MTTRRRVDPDKRFWAKVRKISDGCWLWTAAKRNGYGAFGVRAGLIVDAHRYSWMLIHGGILPGFEVCHHCSNRACCRPSHLFLSTRWGNLHDAIDKGDFKPRRGFKLTPDQVREIKAKIAEGRVQRHLAFEYGVSPSLVCMISKGVRWDWLNLDATSPAA